VTSKKLELFHSRENALRERLMEWRINSSGNLPPSPPVRPVKHLRWNPEAADVDMELVEALNKCVAKVSFLWQIRDNKIILTNK